MKRNTDQLLRREIKKKFVHHILGIKKMVNMASKAKWYEVQCILCGKNYEGSPDWIKARWMHKGCPHCSSRLGYRLIEMSFYQRQRTFYRDRETNEIEKASKEDLAYKITNTQRERTGNKSYKADLKTDGLLRRPSMNRTHKILNKKPKYDIEVVRDMKEENKLKHRRW